MARICEIFFAAPAPFIADYRRFNEVMRSDCPSRARVFRWIGRFSAGDQSCQDEARSEQISGPSIASRKVCYGFFLSPYDLVAQIPSPPCTVVTGKFYCDSVLPKVLRSFNAMLQGRAILLHHDNAPAHRSDLVAAYIDQSGYQTFAPPTLFA